MGRTRWSPAALSERQVGVASHRCSCSNFTGNSLSYGHLLVHLGPHGIWFEVILSWCFWLHVSVQKVITSGAI